MCARGASFSSPDRHVVADNERPLLADSGHCGVNERSLQTWIVETSWPSLVAALGSRPGERSQARNHLDTPGFIVNATCCHARYLATDNFGHCQWDGCMRRQSSIVRLRCRGSWSALPGGLPMMVPKQVSQDSSWRSESGERLPAGRPRLLVEAGLGGKG